MTFISSSVFEDCGNLTSIFIPDSVTSIGDRAFHRCWNLTSIVIPDSVTSIGNSAFLSCSRLTSIVIPDSVTSVGGYAFCDCTSLASVVIPDSVTSIGGYAFNNCTSLSSIDIPNSVTSIGNGAFWGCKNIVAVRAPNLKLVEAYLKDFKKLKVLITEQAEEPIADDAVLNDTLNKLAALRKDKKARIEAAALAGQILQSNLPAAMRFAEKEGMLDLYASLRGMTADDLREYEMSDLGLDEHGERRWNLDGRDIVAALDADLVLTLTDTRTAKTVTTIPKKNADPTDYEKAAKALKEMKKALSEMKKLWGAKLFGEFLSGYSREVERWKKLFLQNPMMRGMGRLLVWQQGTKTFTLHADGLPYDAQGNAYSFTGRPILLAHPMEMGSELTTAWQNHFLTEHLKQPFEQVWEPVVDKALVKPNRYDGCAIELYHLLNRTKHGITMEGQKLVLKECSANLS